MDKVYIGIDPGKNGGIALIVVENNFNTFINSVYEGSTLVEMVMPYLNRYYEVKAVVEKVNAMPGQGVVSMFNFGKIYGEVLGIFCALGVPYELVPPQKWKKEFSVTGDKNTSIDVCQRLFPEVNLFRTSRCSKKHDGMAEALLIAEYARRKLM